MDKLDSNYLKLFNTQDNIKYFGDWINNIKYYTDKFIKGEPYNNVIIPNFLNDELIEQITEDFPCDFQENEDWFYYNNPLEVKYLNSSIENFPKSIKDLYYILSTNQLVNIFSKISTIRDLEYDTTLYGSSLHSHGRNGRLNLHLDYEKHPILENKERRLNLILYLNKEWNDEWNGHSELWNENVSECITKHSVKFNSALLFQTNNMTWHGTPEKIKCPEGQYRKTLAYYYISPLVSKPNLSNYGVDSSGYRTKASFIKRPSDPDYPQLQKMYYIRPNRRITNEDILNIWPEWNSDLF